MNTLITIIGPTATGKSDLAVQIALYIEKKHCKKVEIISADSRQIFKHLDIGTGKITTNEMHGIKHHMLDIIEPSENFSVFAYGKMVRDILKDIHSRGAIPILCGGTGFYVDAVIYGNTGAETSPSLELQKELEQFSIPELNEKLSLLAKEKNISTAHVDIKNKRRVIRALEILLQGGVFAQKNTTPLYSLLQIGLDGNSDVLKNRIQKRLSMRMQQGMIEESEKLLSTEVLTHDRMNTLGLEYRFISQLIQKRITLPEFTEKLFFAIWHYAKRQKVWFKRYSDIHWFQVVEIQKHMEEIHALVDNTLQSK